MSKLADALFSRTQQSVLGLLYAQPARSFYTNEILRSTGMGVATIKRELDRMVQADILSFQKNGNQNHYQANPCCAIYTELLSIVRKTSGIGDVLETTLQPLLDKIEVALVYGPHAANVTQTKQAINLLVISQSINEYQLMSLLGHAEDRLAHAIQLNVINPPQASITQAEKHNGMGITGQLLPSQMMHKPKIWIKGVQSDLRKAG